MKMGYRGMEEVHNEVKDPPCNQQEDNIRANIMYQGQGENGAKKPVRSESKPLYVDVCTLRL